MAKITEDYVSFETAKLLKEKGFEEVCSAYYEDFKKRQHLYMNNKRGNYNIVFKQREDLENRFNLPKERYKCAAPTLQMAMKWLREVHNLCIEPYRTACGYLYTISNIPYGTNLYSDHYKGNDEDSGQWTTYEGACEAAIKYCLENLI